MAAGDWKVDEAEGEGHKPSVATALNVEEVAWGIRCARWGVVDLAPSPILHGAPQSPTIGLGAKARGVHAEVRLTDMLYRADPYYGCIHHIGPEPR